ncbi:MAG: cytochrome-c oxidase, cbb3-type subunit II [Halomonadaceae bacterium]|nr:MAG: cytochrome-c oxidase, cbb3-type subunit II [Halomonadaceae bacterium]
MSHQIIEKNMGLMMILVVVLVTIGGAAEIVPLFFDDKITEPVDGLKPLTAKQLEGRDIYIREGCHVCHTQMVRPFRHETERYGHYSVAGEYVYDHPFMWGSKRTGPDLTRVGGRYSDEWHRLHLEDPRQLVPGSNMPSYPWLSENKVNPNRTARKMRGLRFLGVPYTDEDIAGAADALEDTLEMDALIAYLQQLGTVISERR